MAGQVRALGQADQEFGARQTRTRIDNHIVDELRRLGAQQKELFRQGGGVLQQEYATLLAEIKRAMVRMAP